MSIRFFPSFLCTLALGLVSGSAQNFVPNGNFLKTSTQDDLWDGVDASGALTGQVRALTGLNDANHLAEVAMPVSVSVGDLNGDGLPDLMMADSAAYFYVYFNSGTKEQPKFTHAELIPLFVSRPSFAGVNRHDYTEAGLTSVALAPRIDLADMGRRGLLDIVAGFYSGDMVLIPNTGSRNAPAYRQPPNPGIYVFPTSAQNLRWANLLSPAVVDWNKDGKPDLLVGDGSYSANSVFLLLNQGSGPQPKFTEQSRSYLVYGNGRTQLSPTVADYNGDGLPDVIAADRTGRVTVNLNQANAKPGVPLENSSFITFGSSDSVRSSVTVKAADMNGDGLFDLVFGKSNGRLAMALNTGTKEQPKFGLPEEIKGEDVYKRDVQYPASWGTEAGNAKGNFLSRVTVVNAATDPNAQPPSGKNCLRIGYDQPLNKIIPMLPPPNTKPDAPKIEYIFTGIFGGRLTSAGEIGASAPVNAVILQTVLKELEPNKPYELSFFVKGAAFRGQYNIGIYAWGQEGEQKITRGERGSATIDRNSIADVDIQDGTFGANAQWTRVSKTVTFHFARQPALNNPKTWKGSGKIIYTGTLVLRTDIDPYGGVCYIDNVQLVPKATP